MTKETLKLGQDIVVTGKLLFPKISKFETYKGKATKKHSINIALCENSHKDLLDSIRSFEKQNGVTNSPVQEDKHGRISLKAITYNVVECYDQEGDLIKLERDTEPFENNSIVSASVSFNVKSEDDGDEVKVYLKCFLSAVAYVSPPVLSDASRSHLLNQAKQERTKVITNNDTPF